MSPGGNYLKQVKRRLFSAWMLWKTLSECSFDPDPVQGIGCLGMAAETGSDWAVPLMYPFVRDYDVYIFVDRACQMGFPLTGLLILQQAERELCEIDQAVDRRELNIFIR